LAPFFSLLIFHVFPRTKNEIFLGLIIALLVIYIVAPIALFYFPTMFGIEFDLISLDSFRGFAESRTDYGYIAGIVILMLMARPSPIMWLVLPVLFFGIILSENRASLVAIVVTTSYLLTTNQKLSLRANRIPLILFVISISLLIYYFGSATAERGVALLDDSGDRVDITYASLDLAARNFLFGAGGFYQQVTVFGSAVEPHNAILQSVINFGVFTTLFWYLMVLKLFLSMNPNGRAFILYAFLFGMFHPAFDAFLFVPESLLAMLSAVYFGFEYRGAKVRLPFPSRKSPELSGHGAPVQA
jgi:hypothetical protein